MKTLKKTLFVLLAVVTMTVIFCFGASALSETGWCGDNVYWEYNYDLGTLNINGSGDTWDYGSTESPFYCSEDIIFVSVEDGVSSIGDLLFEGCNNLVAISLPDSITSIGKGAFFQCNSLAGVTIPYRVSSIGEAAFLFSGLKSILVNKNNRYFSNDSYGVLFNKNKTKIIQYPSLSTNTTYMIPASVTSIAATAFFACGLKSITVDKNSKNYSNDNYGVLFNKNKTKLCVFPAFSSHTTYTIPDSVTSIVDGAFMGCYSLKSVTLPASLTSISDLVFMGCENLQSITIPGSITFISTGAFNFCNNLSVVHYVGTQNQWNKVSIDSENGGLLGADIHFCSEKTTQKATPTANGKIKIICSDCSYSITKSIPKANKLTLSTTKYTYDGTNKTPKVTVKDSNGKTLVKGTDYKLTVASKRSAVGRHTVKVTFMGNYSGTKSIYFYILPGKSASVKSSAQTASAIKLTWSKVAGASGYTVYRYSPSKKAYVKAGATTGTSYTVKNLLAGTKYTFKVVAYGKTSSGKVYNSNTYALIKTATCTKTPTVKLASTAKGRATVAWTDVSGETGYQLYYATSKNGTYSKIANYKANTAKAYKTGLKSGRTYYFKVRTYINTDSGYVYSPFSAVKSVKIK